MPKPNPFTSGLKKTSVKVNTSNSKLKSAEPIKIKSKVTVKEQPPKEEPPKKEPAKVEEPPKVVAQVKVAAQVKVSAPVKVVAPVKVAAPAKPAGEAPELVEPLEKEYKVKAEATCTIDCVVKGKPEPEVEWFFENKQIKDAGRFRYLFEENDIVGLEIRKVTVEDEGVYKCVCFNDDGQVESKTLLIVESKKVEKVSEEKKVDSAALKKATFTPKKTKKKLKLPIERKNIKAENPEKYYTFGEEIGRGKFSVVKECTSKKDNQKYAAKIIKFDDSSLKFAIREYDLMQGKLTTSKGTVKLHEAYLVRKYLILIMEFVPGKSLLDKVSHMHSISEEEVADVVRQLCEILAGLHAQNVVHLDIRPTNIRFVNSKELKLLDYNSARSIANKKAGEVVDVIGDTEFCAPEMLQFEPVGPGSDMWSVAVITYILLSGISPFYYEVEDKVLDCVEKVKWKFDDEAFSNVTSEAKDFIKKCFVRIPESRMSAEKALQHKWLQSEYSNARKRSVLSIQDVMVETDERLYSEEEEEYVDASLVFRTFEEEEYESPEESDDDEE